MRARRPWWKKRRTRWSALLAFGLLGPVWCPLLPWEGARAACDVATTTARLVAGALAPLPPVSHVPGVFDAADGGA